MGRNKTRKKYRRRRVMTIVFTVIIILGFSKNKLKGEKKINLNSLIEMNIEELEEVKGRGKKLKDPSGRVISSTYKESIFGVDRVKSTYYFFDDRNKISSIKMYFPKKSNIDDIIKGITDDLGEPTIREEDDKDCYIEWNIDEKIYYTLNNVKEVEDGSLAELTVIVLP